MTNAILAATIVGQDGSLIAIIADRRLSTAALSALFLRDPTYRVIEHARGIREVRALVAAFQPGITILDSSWSAEGPSVELAAWEGSHRILVLLDREDDPAVFLQALTASAHGYVSRSAPGETLEAAVASLRTSGWYLDPLLVPPMLLAMRRAAAGVLPQAGLSRREDDILIRIASGRSTKEIAREYAITPKTVSNHVNNIYRKLNLNHRGELVLYAAQKGLSHP